MTTERALWEATGLLINARVLIDEFVDEFPEHETNRHRARLLEIDQFLWRTGGVTWAIEQVKAWEAEKRKERGW